MKSEADFVWSDFAQAAFEKLRDSLIAAPALVQLNPSSRHEVRTDASSHAIGGVLQQIDEDKDQTGVVTFSSKTLPETDLRYSVTERQLCAAFKTILALLGKKFTLVTDNAALSSLRNAKDPPHRLTRWSAQLFSFDSDVVHKKRSATLTPTACRNF